MARLVLLLAPLLLSGCVSELLGPEEATTRTTACAVLQPDEVPELVVRVHQAAPARAGGSAWLDAIAEVSGRAPERMSLDLRDGPRHDGPWTAMAMDEWLGEVRVLERDRVILHALWVPELSAGPETVDVWAPGVIAINASAADAGAEATGLGKAEVGLALLFHGFGHALGVVNAGIPMHSQDTTGREAPQHHEPETGSVMHVAWHRVDDMPVNVTLAYTEPIVEDWQQAVGPGGACVE